MVKTVVLPVLKNVKSIFLAVLFVKLCALTTDLASQLFSTEEKNAVNKFIATILNEYRCCRAVIKQFDKNRVLTVDDEKSNKC